MNAKFDPDWVVAPGETLAEWFASMHLPTTIAEHYDISQRTLLGVFSGKRQIGPVLAQKLCNMTHIGAPFWLALEHNYRVGLASGKVLAGQEGKP